MSSAFAPNTVSAKTAAAPARLIKDYTVTPLFPTKLKKLVHGLHTLADEGRCGCMRGLPCSCALKRDNFDAGDLSKVLARNSLSHRRVQSYNKPTVATRRSDSVVPKYAHNPHHLHFHRNNHAAQELGHPYPRQKFSRSTDNFDLSQQRSSDSLPMYGSGMAYQQPLPDITSAPRSDCGSLSRVNSPVFGAADLSSAPRSGYYPGSGMNSPVLPSDISSAPRQSYLQSPGMERPVLDSNITSNPTPFTPPLDMNFTSPANPARYSLNDFSKFSMTDFGGAQFTDQALLSASPSSDRMSPDPSSWNMDNNYSYGTVHHPAPQRSSMMSNIDHPGLCYSPVGSVSDAGESIANSVEPSYTSAPRQATPIDGSWMGQDFQEPLGIDMKAENYSNMGSPYMSAGAQSSAASFDDYLSMPTSAPIQELKSNANDMSRMSATPPPYKQQSASPVPIASDFTSQPPMDQWNMSPQNSGFYHPADMSGLSGSGSFS